MDLHIDVIYIKKKNSLIMWLFARSLTRWASKLHASTKINYYVQYSSHRGIVREVLRDMSIPFFFTTVGGLGQ